MSILKTPTPLTADYWAQINKQSRPHEVFNLDWGVYGSLDFGDTFLPYTNNIKTERIGLFDGAGLFPNRGIEDAIFRFNQPEGTLSIMTFSYPENVLAEQKKNRVRPTKDEICVFIEIDEKGAAKVHLNFGQNFANFLQIEEEDPASIGKTIFATDMQTISQHFSKGLGHFRMAQFILGLIGLEATMTEATTEEQLKNEHKDNAGKAITGSIRRDLEADFIYAMDKYLLKEKLLVMLKKRYKEVFRRGLAYNLDLWKKVILRQYERDLRIIHNPATSQVGTINYRVDLLKITEPYPTVEEYFEIYDKDEGLNTYYKIPVNPKYHPYILKAYEPLLNIMMPLIFKEEEITKLKKEPINPLSVVTGKPVTYFDIFQFYLLQNMLSIYYDFSFDVNAAHQKLEKYYTDIFKTFKIYLEDNRHLSLRNNKGKQVQTEVTFSFVTSNDINTKTIYSVRNHFYGKIDTPFLVIDEIAEEDDRKYKLNNGQIAQKIKELNNPLPSKRTKDRGIKIIVVQKNEGQRSSAEKNGMFAYINANDFPVYDPIRNKSSTNQGDFELISTLAHEAGHLFGLEDRYSDILCYTMNLRGQYDLKIAGSLPRPIDDQEDPLAMRADLMLGNLMCFAGPYITEYQAKILLGMAGKYENIDVEKSYPKQRILVPCGHEDSITNTNLDLNGRPKPTLMLSMNENGELVSYKRSGRRIVPSEELEVYENGNKLSEEEIHSKIGILEDDHGISGARSKLVNEILNSENEKILKKLEH